MNSIRCNILLILLIVASIRDVQSCVIESQTIIPCASTTNIEQNIACGRCTDIGCTLCRKVSLSTCCDTGCFTCQRCPRQPNVCAQACRSAECDLPPVCPQREYSSNTDGTFFPRSIFVPRSVGANTARELVGWQWYIHRAATPCNYITMAQTFGYNHSFRPERIARYLFGDCFLNFAGSQVIDRTPCELLADNFGLSTRFRGSARVCPTIENFYLDNQIFFGLDNIACGLYARIHAPLVYTRWNLHLCPLNTQQECPEFPACYMSTNSTAASCDIVQALSGSFTFGNMQEPWHFGKFCPQKLTRVGLADIDFIVGWDALKCPQYHVGLYAQVVAPTGNKPKSRFIFEPIIGNSGHWELGGGISSHLLLWEKDLDQSLALFFEGNVTHMFKNRQCRSFDLCDKGPLSRYLLLKEFENNNNTLVPTGRLVNAINITTVPADVSVSVKGDLSLKLAYKSCCFSFDVGYNFYGHSSETVCLSKKNTLVDNARVGIKGTEGVCALNYAISPSLPPVFGPLQSTVALNSTQSNATIRAPGKTDNPQSISIAPQTIAVTALSAQTGVINGPGVIVAQTSNPPVILSTEDLHIRSGAAGATATHKIFGYIAYDFINWCSWGVPYIGFGGELEVEGLACFEQTSLNQWGLWLKGGIAF